MNSHSIFSSRYSQKDITTLYRIQNLNNFFNLQTVVLGVYSSSQRTILSEDVVEHQKSAFLVGSTTSEEVVNQLQQKWNSNGILTINPAFIMDHLIDVNKIINSVRSSYFTEINEHEQCMTTLPICAVKSIKFVNENKSMDNPFYIDPASQNVIAEYKIVYQVHKQFLEALYESGETMSKEARQSELAKLVNIYDDFYQKYLGNNNPLAMTVTQLKSIFGESYFDKALNQSLNDQTNETIKDLIMREGDNLFSSKDEYKRLLSRKRTELIMQQNAECGYGSRSSYSWD